MAVFSGENFASFNSLILIEEIHFEKVVWQHFLLVAIMHFCSDIKLFLILVMLFMGSVSPITLIWHQSELVVYWETFPKLDDEQQHN